MTAGVMSLPLLLLNAGILAQAVHAQPPEVTLCHGGKLQGGQVNAGNNIVFQFLGIRYAKPPVRFQRPERAEPWTGVYNATTSRSKCVQPDVLNGGIHGSEDCLFLDMYVPNYLRQSRLRPVMVFIHGGGYIHWEGSAYIGAPLAAHGDVIVVNINYRLGLLGFLFNGPGTGNFGLWDQRAALVWVRENIELFGGDPDRITIFGESAGAGSVAAQMMGRYNDGLFKRGIIQSGALHTLWGWYSTKQSLQQTENLLRRKACCADGADLYECLRSIPAKDLDGISNFLNMSAIIWHPQPDNDFFPADVTSESYELSKRFDLLIGFNGLEGPSLMAFDFDIFLATKNETWDDGVTLESTVEFLTDKCSQRVTAEAPELCVDFITSNYNITDATRQERLMRLAHAMGDLYVAADVYDMMSKHSESCQKRTYGYYYTHVLNVTKVISTYPQWASTSAMHAAELPVVFGTGEFTSDMIDAVKDGMSYFSGEFLYFNADFDDVYYRLSSTVMTMWTNFATSGSPNSPKPTGRLYWPEYGATKKLLNIDSRLKVIDVPGEELLVKLKAVLGAAARRRSISAPVQ